MYRFWNVKENEIALFSLTTKLESNHRHCGYVVCIFTTTGVPQKYRFGGILGICLSLFNTQLDSDKLQ